MNPRKLLKSGIAGGLIYLLAATAQAESYRDIGDYVVHYNALSTDILEPQIARAYGITRGKSRGMLNIAVLKKMPGTTGTPVAATVAAHSTNLNGQITELRMREVREQQAIYYIGEFSVSHRENLTFNISVSPEKSRPPQTIQFSRQFFTD